MRLIALLTAVLGVALPVCATRALAGTGHKITVVARITPEEGLIADAAMLNDSHLALLYPQAGRIADYTLDGQLYQHILRESGVDRRFRPTACAAFGPVGIAVFDEAAMQVFVISDDGNFQRGFELAYQGAQGAPATALSAVGDLACPDEQTIWATLPEKGVLARFDSAGKQKQLLDLATELPYLNGVYTRGSLLPDGSLFVLDYGQGAVIYRQSAEPQYHRLALGTPEWADAAPALQDMAVDEQGDVLIVSSIEDKPVLLLTPVENGYDLHTVDLQLPISAPRMACRYSRGRFILWLRDRPYVVVLELR
jgi:hypothetical protein